MTPAPSRSERWLRRLHSALQWLHPPRHRRRHRLAIDAMLNEVLGGPREDLHRRRVLRRAIGDAVTALALSWRDALTRPLGTVGPMLRSSCASLSGDVSFAVRFHRRQPVYALVTVATLAVAIGANTAILTVAQAALFRGLPYDSPDRFVEVQRQTQGLLSMVRRGEDFDWVPGEKLVSTPGIAGAATYIPGGGANLVADAAAQRRALVSTSENFFAVAGVDMELGTGFTAVEGRTDVVVIAHAVWAQDFGADPDILGRTIRLSGLRFTVVGVAPTEVAFPGRTELWVPQPMRWDFYSDAAGPTLIARLAPAADRGAVEELLVARTAPERAQIPAEAGPPPLPTLVPLRDVLTDSIRVPLIVLSVAAALVFLLGCFNLAGVAVSHYLRRSAELQIRIALGAGRMRVYRQLAVEALLLAVIGGAAGLWVAAVGIDALVASLPGDVPGLSSAHLATGSLALSVTLAAVAGLFINAIPALHVVAASRSDVAARMATESPRQARLRSALTIAQVTVALILLVAAGLLGRSLVGLATTPIGIDLESVLTFEAHVTQPLQAVGEDDEVYRARVRAARDRYLERVEEGLAEIPSVVGVGAASQLPLSSGMTAGRGIRAEESRAEDRVSVQDLQATAGYFSAIGIPFLSGGPFSRAAGAGTEVVLSRAAAQSLFGTANAAGRTVLFSLRFDEWTPLTVSGVVEDIRYHGPDSEQRATVYRSLLASPDAQIGFAVRVQGEPTRIADAVTRMLLDIDPSVPPYNLQSSRQALSRELATRRTVATVSGLFALTAMLLAGIGIYGLIAESVARRRREIGVRMALGARAGTVIAMVTGRGIALAAAGTVLAMPLVLWGGNLLDGMLYSVSPQDPGVMLAAPLILLGVATLAAWLPARRAARVDPVEVLSGE